MLNAGCGNNEWGNIRIDIDPKAKGKTHLMNICKIQFPDKSFTVTKCDSVLEHIQDWRQAINELCRVTNKLLIITVPVNSDLRKTDVIRLLFPSLENIKLFLNLKKRAKETLWQFKPDIVKREIEKHSFNVNYRRIFRFYHFYPSRMYQFVCKRK